MKTNKAYQRACNPIAQALMRRDGMAAIGRLRIDANIHALIGEDAATAVQASARIMFIALGAADTPQAAPQSIRSGQAVVPWAAATRTGAPLFQSIKAGWALPGGARTQDHEHAFFVAQEINCMIAANTAKTA